VNPAHPPEHPFPDPVVPEETVRFRRNREEVVWLVFVLLFGGAFAGTAAAVFVRRLLAEAALGQYDPAFDVLWALLAVSLLATYGYYVVTVVRFLRRVVTIGPNGVAVGAGTIPWEGLSALREERIQKRFYVFCRFELTRSEGEFIPVTSALIADYEGFRDAVCAGRPDLDLEVDSH